MAGLNPAQRAAGRYLDDPCPVMAGAGRGTTRVITQTIGHLIERVVAPRWLAASTLTNKAAPAR